VLLVAILKFPLSPLLPIANYRDKLLLITQVN
jgi:hypothetical protein